MKRIWTFVLATRLSIVIRLACVCTGLSLVTMVLLVLVKIPLFLVLGVGVAHGLGILGVLLFAVAVIKETLLLPIRARSMPPKPGTAGPSDQSPR